MNARAITYPRRIVIYGVESTGKSSLARWLAELFQAPWSQEYVRQYWDDHQGVITATDLDIIARGQIANEEAAIAQARDLVFFDTDLLTCTLWDDLLFPGACPAWVRETAIIRAKQTDLYLFCQPDIPFEDDPQRCFSEQADREHLTHEIWEKALHMYDLPFVRIAGEWTDRHATALMAIRQLREGKAESRA